MALTILELTCRNSRKKETFVFNGNCHISDHQDGATVWIFNSCGIVVTETREEITAMLRGEKPKYEPPICNQPVISYQPGK